MIRTITQYRPGIYLLMARRAAARERRKERMCQFFQLLVCGLLGALFGLYCGWLLSLTLRLFLN